MKRPDLAAWIVCGLALLGVVVLALFHVPVPDVLVTVLTGTFGAAAGISVSNPGNGSVDVAALLSRLESLVGLKAASPAARPAPVPLTTEPPTGVFRAATHAPS